MIDSHAHIYLPEFKDDLSEVLGKCAQNGVHKILMPNIDSATIDDMLGVERQYGDICKAMIGLHPCSVDANFEKELEIVQEWLMKRDFIAIGEIGTDLYWDKAFWPQQQQAFKRQCEMAIEHKLPIVIHCRESIPQTIELVKPFSQRGLTGVFHCFTGNEKQASEIIEMGFYLGMGGVVTFKNAGMDKVIGNVGIEKLLLETDSPYLAPAPNRGKRNDPSMLPLICEKIAKVTETSVDQVVGMTVQNTKKLFGL